MGWHAGLVPCGVDVTGRGVNQDFITGAYGPCGLAVSHGYLHCSNGGPLASGGAVMTNGAWQHLGVIGRLHHIILDCRDPATLAEFYAMLLGHPVTYRSAEFCVVAPDERSSGVAFQLAPDHVSPTWPTANIPQQIHLDVMVDDVEAAGEAALTLGARHVSGSVYADPAGHPFCLVPRPSWAPPIGTQ